MVLTSNTTLLTFILSI